MINMFKLVTIILTLTAVWTNFSFLIQPWKNDPIIMEKMLLCFRRAKLLVCIKKKKTTEKNIKLMELGLDMSNMLLKPVRIMQNCQPCERNVVREKKNRNDHGCFLKCLVKLYH